LFKRIKTFMREWRIYRTENRLAKLRHRREQYDKWVSYQVDEYADMCREVDGDAKEPKAITPGSARDISCPPVPARFRRM